MNIKSLFRRSDTSSSPTLKHFRLRKTCRSKIEDDEYDFTIPDTNVVIIKSAPRPITPIYEVQGINTVRSGRDRGWDGKYGGYGGQSSAGGDNSSDWGGRQVMYVQHDMIHKHNDNEEDGCAGNDCDGGDGGD